MGSGVTVGEGPRRKKGGGEREEGERGSCVLLC